VTEDELRVLGGAELPAGVVTFAGEEFALAGDGLAALIAFVRVPAEQDGEGGTSLAAIYELLSRVVTDFPRFERAAFSTRAGIGEVGGLVAPVVSWYCGRSHWPAYRLLGFLAHNLEEIDGQLIRAGHGGVVTLSARQACNVALAICLDGRSDDDRDAFMMDLNYEGDAADDALARLREWQRERKAATQLDAEVLTGG